MCAECARLFHLDPDYSYNVSSVPPQDQHLPLLLGPQTSNMASSPTPPDEGADTVTYEEFKTPLQEYIDENLPVYSKLCWVRPHNTIMNHTYQSYHNKHRHYPCRATDIWVASFPKAGTTWMQELTWCLLHGTGTEQGKKHLMYRFPFFEWDSMLPDWKIALFEERPDGDPLKLGEQWKILSNMADPRTIKTHLYRELLPMGVTDLNSKVIYVMRDPRDVCVSLYYHSVKLIHYTGDFDNFVKLFLGDAYVWAPFWSNVLSYWRRRHDAHLLLLRYEDMQEDLFGVLQKVAAFIGVSPTPEEQRAIAVHVSFNNMRANPATDNEFFTKDYKQSDREQAIKFMRKGIAGDYKNHLSHQQLLQFKEWTDRNLQGTDFPFYRD